ncbi:AMP-binding protein [Halorubrum halodurans]|uniref:AMP-dependent synthetase n=1 Tax=Halorubrum halodurans TaxID=1383851 RepID=A0A256IHK2_9EURY|nr:class I adenylate-forming enzyme family protein [Halorubrum halodurans]OYR55796.1 hypothetical protein DJ70_10760 [Halorubrum halodurans]
MSLFWWDIEREIEVSYGELVQRISNREKRHSVLQTSEPDELFTEILIALLTESEFTLLDSEFSSETLSELGFDARDLEQTEPVPKIEIEDPSDLPKKIRTADDEWTLGIYTSGTTGTPTRVEQTLGTLTQSVRTDERFDDNVWAFAYNPTHIAGLQVFFQAVSNLNPMIYIFEHSVDQIEEVISEYEVTHISATPTFYRLRLQRLGGTYPSVKRLTSGGEMFEPQLKESLKERFPNAKFRNVYALTEAGSLLESNGELFEIPDEKEDQFKITEDNELAVYESLLAESAAEEFDGEWYHTGDEVEFVEGDEFRFAGRQSDFINVGGYRVNPHDVERRISSIDGVQAAIVRARESSVTGHILTAEVQPVPDADGEVVETAVEEQIGDLERWKQPRIIDIVDEIEKTRSGKRVR